MQCIKTCRHHQYVQLSVFVLFSLSFVVSPSVLLEMVTRIQSELNGGLVHQMPYWASKPDFASCLNQVCTHVYTVHTYIYVHTNIPIFDMLLCMYVHTYVYIRMYVHT